VVIFREIQEWLEPVPILEIGRDGERQYDGRSTSGAARELSRYLAGRGTPALVGGMSEAPFDTIGDSYRGIRGVFTDMFRYPDALLEACEKFVTPLIRKGVAMADASGVPLIFMPLHKGADEFMSGEQF
jgi:hypothetical protein